MDLKESLASSLRAKHELEQKIKKLKRGWQPFNTMI
jgi:hypothetical protein